MDGLLKEFILFLILGQMLSHFRKVLTKLEIWKLEEYERIVLDSDILVIKNIDELFIVLILC